MHKSPWWAGNIHFKTWPRSQRPLKRRKNTCCFSKSTHTTRIVRYGSCVLYGKVGRRRGVAHTHTHFHSITRSLSQFGEKLFGHDFEYELLLRFVTLQVRRMLFIWRNDTVDQPRFRDFVPVVIVTDLGALHRHLRHRSHSQSM